MDDKRTMKPMLAACIQEALHMALIDCTAADMTSAQRDAAEEDIYAIPSDLIAGMDPVALGQNLACRLLGTGGWNLPTPSGPLYTGNATTRETFEASFDRPDRDFVGEVAFDLMPESVPPVEEGSDG